MTEMAPSIPAADQPLGDMAKSTVGECELPTGYIDSEGNLHTHAVVTEITGAEEDILMSKRMQAHTKLQQVMEACVVSIGDVKREGNSQWSKVIKSLVALDRLALILAIRKVTLGNVLSFKTQCTHEGCGHVSSQVVDLNDFKLVGMKDPAARTWKGTLPSGKTYMAKVMTGVEEDKLAKVEDKKDSMSLAMLARLVELGGVQPVTLEAVRALGMKDRTYFRAQVKEREGSIDNVVDVTCPECGGEFKTAIDVADRSFFFPSEM